MNKDLLKRYSEIKFNISKLTDEAKKIEGDVMSELEELNKGGVDNIKSDFGTLYLTSRKSWKYSDNVVKLEKEFEQLVKEPQEKIKIAKKEEEEKGIATFDEKKSVAFRSK